MREEGREVAVIMEEGREVAVMEEGRDVAVMGVD